MMKNLLTFKRLLLLNSFLYSSLFAAILPHQGRVLINGEAFDGIGFFKFALISQSGDIRWSHGGTTEVPIHDLPIGVKNGFYQVKLGDVSIQGMEPLPDEHFAFEDPLSLRIWFSDGNSKVEQLGPDQPLQIAPYAITTPLTKTDEIAYLLTQELETQATEKGTTTPSLVERLVLIAGNTPENDFNGSIPLSMLRDSEMLLKYLQPSFISTSSDNVLVEEDGNLTISAEFDGRFLSYQWKRVPVGDDTAIEIGENSNILSIPNAKPEDHNGVYTVTASNDFGSVTSTSILVIVSGAVIP